MRVTEEVAKRRNEATAAHHEKMARVLESFGKTKDAAAARKLAERVRKSATAE